MCVCVCVCVHAYICVCVYTCVYVLLFSVIVIVIFCVKCLNVNVVHILILYSMLSSSFYVRGSRLINVLLLLLLPTFDWFVLYFCYCHQMRIKCIVTLYKYILI